MNPRVLPAVLLPMHPFKSISGLTLALLIAGTQPASAQTFGFTGAEQAYLVPAGVHSIHVEAVGARGGSGTGQPPELGGAGGFGSRVEAVLPVTPGQTLFVEVGGSGVDGVLGGTGAGGFNGGGGSNEGTREKPGGGGGGATDIRTCSRQAATCEGAPNTLASRLFVAGGGGGGGSFGAGEDPSSMGGKGGDAGQDGLLGATLISCGGSTPGGGGMAGTQTAGGAGGNGGSGNAPAGGPGAPGQGGAAGTTGSNTQPGGGGGGGYFGGGAGGSANGCAAGGGGGGSSFASLSATNVLFAIERTDPARVVITALDPPAKPSNAFRIGKLIRNKHKGTGVLLTEIPGPGTLSLAGKGLLARRLSPGVSGTVRLPVRAKSSSGRLLSRTGQVKVTAKVIFTPTGGDPSVQTRAIRLIKRI